MPRTARNQRTLSLRPRVVAEAAPVIRILKTPSSSTYPSAYPTEDEADDNDKKPTRKTFNFLRLPSEIRNTIYSMVYSSAPAVIDLDPHTFSLLNRQKILAVFSVSRQVHLEATHHFFSTHTFRIFPTYPGRYFKTKKPLLARLPQHYRESITSLELRVGPGWNNPPRGWVVNDALGLQDCTSVRVLKVFVEVDPSDGIFKGFRAGDGFYEKFCQGLLADVLKGVPTVDVVEFDAWPSVKRTGDMMRGLGEIIIKMNKVIAWGPERGWEKESDQVWMSAMLGGALSKSIAIFA